MTSHSSINDSLVGGSSHAPEFLAPEFLAHEVRNLVNVAILSFEVLKSTGAGVAGAKGQVLRRSLNDLRTLINRSLSDVRSRHGRDAIAIGDFVNEIAAVATLEAHAKGIRLVVSPVQDGLVVEADRHELGAAVRNLVQNAVKFTRPDSTVHFRVGSSGERVYLEVHDECGGLPGGSQEHLFRPFEQRGRDRSGLGLGLAFSRTVVEANGGTLSIRNFPGHGCVFAIALPRSLHLETCAVRDSDRAALRA